MNFSIRHSLGREYAELCYQTFFKDPSRVKDLSFYFPWIVESQSEKYFFECFIAGRLAAGLLLKIEKVVNLKIAKIGLVTVAPEYRGLGISSDLLERAKMFCNRKGIDVIALWTSKSKVYSKVGFEISRDLQNFEIQNLNNSITAGRDIGVFESDSKINQIGFLNIKQYSYKSADVVLGVSKLEHYMLDWKGEPDDIISSFNWKAIQSFKDLFISNYGIIFDKEEELFQAQSLSNHDEDLFFMAHHTLIDSRNFDLPKEKTVLWTVNDEIDFQRYMEMEIYGIVTDIPDTMQLYRK